MATTASTGQLKYIGTGATIQQLSCRSFIVFQYSVQNAFFFCPLIAEFLLPYDFILLINFIFNYI